LSTSKTQIGPAEERKISYDSQTSSNHHDINKTGSERRNESYKVQHFGSMGNLDNLDNLDITGTIVSSEAIPETASVRFTEPRSLGCDNVLR